MNRHIFRACLSLLLLQSLFSCSDDDDDVKSAITGDCSVKSVVMGTLYRDYTTQLATGEDTTYVTNVPGSTYQLSIDHLRGLIYNVDSLPPGTRVDKVKFATFTADGTIALRLASGRDTLFTTNDSVDFTEPRVFTIYSADGKGQKEYTMRLNVAQLNSANYSWHGEPASEQIASLGEARAFALRDSLFVFANNGGGLRVLRRAMADEGAAWQAADATGAAQPQLQSLCAFGGAFYALSGNALCRSDNGADWTVVDAVGQASVAALLGASSARIYLRVGNEIVSSADGASFTADALDQSADFLPTEQVRLVSLPSFVNPDIENELLFGYSNGESRTWKKELNLDGVEQNPWSYYPITQENPRQLPLMSDLSMFAYNGHITAIGLYDGEPQAWMSQDGGRTWHIQLYNNYLPRDFGTPPHVSAAADSHNRIWLVCPGTGAIWRGRLNSLPSE